MELWDWRFAPHERYESEDHQPGTREMAHVLVGEIVVTVDGLDHIVLAGQTLDFRGDRVHAYRNQTDSPARVVMVVTMPPGEFDRRPPSASDSGMSRQRAQADFAVVAGPPAR